MENSRYEFRAWHKDGAMMGCHENGPYTQAYQGQVFKWLDEGQPIVIMQYTGLKDANGVKIFEGDIVFFEFDEDGSAGVIEWSEYGYWKALIKHKNYDESEILAEMIEGKVIGNIHENPELLGA